MVLVEANNLEEERDGIVDCSGTEKEGEAPNNQSQVGAEYVEEE